ncbi:VOC family protein [Sodalis sp. dw_96]|uniref:VOC family protein n=1 Tax=Sodalis sp. dw_96 TaxID=2719794 RepID=UPI0031F70E47
MKKPNWQEISQLTDLSEDLIRFSSLLAALVHRLDMDLTGYYIDHIALRCHQDVTAQRWFNGWQQCGHCLKQSVVNGRNIALFTLPAPIEFSGLTIDCIELPWPGQRRYPHEGWEHIEIVLPGPAPSLAQRALALLSDGALASPDIRIKHSAPQGENESLPNPTLAVTDGHVTIKFHPHSLRDIAGGQRH